MSLYDEMLQLARQAKQASRVMAKLSSAVKDELLRRMADALELGVAELLAANEKDVAAGRQKGLSAALVDRLVLDEQRIRAMADGLREVASLPDPVG